MKRLILSVVVGFFTLESLIEGAKWPLWPAFSAAIVAMMFFLRFLDDDDDDKEEG